MKYTKRCILPVFLLFSSSLTLADSDKRQLVELPEMMQQHMLTNMRDHLAAINEILLSLSEDKLDQAAEIAEARIGMSSLDSHGADHMGKFMPKAMRDIGNGMHRAASRFALRAQEGNKSAAYRVLTEITSACVSCHAGFRIH